MKTFFILIFTFFTVINCRAQEAYMLKDSSVLMGIKLIEASDYNNSHFVELLLINGEKKRYLPSEISEYAFKSGRTYESKKINLKGANKTVFLERLTKNYPRLYYYKSSEHALFFIALQADSLVEIPILRNEELLTFINTYSTNCNLSELVEGSVHYNKKELSKIFNIDSTCKKIFLKKNTLSFTAGLTKIKIYKPNFPNNILGPASLETLSAYNLGVYYSIPISFSILNNQVFTLQTGSYLNSYGFEGSYREQNTTTYYSASKLTLNIPIALRLHQTIKSKFEYYIFAGSLIELSLKDKFVFLQDNYADGRKYIGIPAELEYFSKYSLGYTLGVGLKEMITKRKNIFLEFRYNSFPQQDYYISNKDFQICIGYEL